jgi:hypothetical protein
MKIVLFNPEVFFGEHGIFQDGHVCPGAVVHSELKTPHAVTSLFIYTGRGIPPQVVSTNGVTEIGVVLAEKGEDQTSPPIESVPVFEIKDTVNKELTELEAYYFFYTGTVIGTQITRHVLTPGANDLGSPYKKISIMVQGVYMSEEPLFDPAGALTQLQVPSYITDCNLLLSNFFPVSKAQADLFKKRATEGEVHG